MIKLNKKELENNGYFFHPGGDFPLEKYAPKKRGIWKKYPSPVKATYIGKSWADAQEHYDREPRAGIDYDIERQ